MKKQWISVKCGLSRDPKHRQAMGESVWLFLHVLDIACWEDGIAHDWKDEAAAEDMGIPVRTLREHRRRLAELGYITCNQKQYTQDIVIHNWTNPREYNGQVYNKKQGDMDMEAQDYIQGDTQGSRNDVTPTYSSNIKESIPKTSFDKNQAGIKRGSQEWKDKLKKELVEKDPMLAILAGENVSQEWIDQNKLIQEALQAFERDMNFNPLPWSSTKEWEKLEKFVVDEYKKNSDVWKRYDEWRKGNGKYVGAMSNPKIKSKPVDFIACFPDFLAHVSMYGKRTDKKTDANDIPLSY